MIGRMVGTIKPMKVETLNWWMMYLAGVSKGYGNMLK